MNINFVKYNGGNENYLSYLTNEVEYHYPDEIPFITWLLPSMLSTVIVG